MPELIKTMFLLRLKFGTASTADCTEVKLQHPFRSTQKYDVVFVSGGAKSFGKSSQIETFLRWSGRFRWRWPRSMLYGINFVTIFGGKNVVSNVFGLMRKVDERMATRMARTMLKRFIFFSFLDNGEKWKVVMRDYIIWT